MFGSVVGGSRPCANCESEPVEDKTGQNGDAQFCSKGCRDEHEGNDEGREEPFEWSVDSPSYWRY
jgi:hypothetical protein